MIGNSELQERMAEQMEFALSQTPEALATDNAKLRELVRDMYETIEARNTWWDAFAKDSKRYADRMRELGVDE
jgi:hypothetical protein